MSKQTAKTATRKTVTKAKLADLESRIVDASAPQAAKATGKAKPAGKAAPKAKAAPVKVKTVVSPIRYAIGQGFRPVAGSRLAAHTAAALALLGMTDGKTAPGALVRKVIGATAVNYHSAHGNMERTPDGIKLTAKGKSVFAARAVDAEMVAAFTGIFKTGEPNKAVSITKGQLIAIGE